MLLLLFTCHFVYGQESGCDDRIRTGKFVALSDDGTEKDYTVKRTKKKQIEVSHGGQLKIVSDIKWLDDTHYTLTTTKIVSDTPGCDKVGAVCYVEITDCSNGVQFCKWKQDGCGKGVIRLKQID